MMGKKCPGLDLQDATVYSLHQTAAPPSANTLTTFTKVAVIVLDTINIHFEADDGS